MEDIHFEMLNTIYELTQIIDSKAPNQFFGVKREVIIHKPTLKEISLGLSDELIESKLNDLALSNFVEKRNNDYRLSRMGELEYLRENKKRTLLKTIEEKKLEQIESIIDTNKSVIKTNNSVTETNKSIKVSNIIIPILTFSILTVSVIGLIRDILRDKRQEKKEIQYLLQKKRIR